MAEATKDDAQLVVQLAQLGTHVAQRSNTPQLWENFEATAEAQVGALSRALS